MDFPNSAVQFTLPNPGPAWQPPYQQPGSPLPTVIPAGASPVDPSGLLAETMACPYCAEDNAAVARPILSASGQFRCDQGHLFIAEEEQK
jgi:hypothetical protein